MNAPVLNEDFEDFLRALLDARAEFLLVGAHAMAVHGAPRATGDLDVFVKPSEPNASRVVAALVEFGAPLQAHGVTEADFATPGLVYQVGLPPRRIDVLNEISGVTFEEALADHVAATVGALSIPVIGRAALIRNKRATGRKKDEVDAERIEGLGD